MTEKIIDIHFGPKADNVAHDKIVSRAYGGIIKSVLNAGHEVLVSRGSEHFNFETGELDEAWIPRFGTDGTITTEQRGALSLDMIGSIREMGKVIRPLAPYDIPLLNGPEIIAYDDKLKAYTDLFSDMQARTVDMNQPGAFDILRGDRIVIKPAKGTVAIGVHIGSKFELSDVTSASPEVQYIGQEFVDMTAPFPESIRGIDEADQATLEEFSHRPKELRVFGFYGQGRVQPVPVARIMKEQGEKSDTWLNIDPETLPAELYTKTWVTFSRMAEQTGTTEIYGAVDFLWGTTVSEPDLHWMVGEVNVWKPVVSRRNKDIAAIHDEAMAHQLVRMAQAKGGET